jgi:flagellar biosynthetic protein FlhB
MADTDKDQKTEDPTGKRIGEAADRGQVITSQEVNHWSMLAASALIILVFGDFVAGAIRDRLAGHLSSVHEIALDPASLRALALGLVESLGFTLAAPLAILIAAAVASNVAQHGWVWAVQKLKPKFNSFNPINGLKQKFSLNTLTEFGKDLVKLSVLGTALVLLLWPERARLLDLVGANLPDLLPVVRFLVLKVLLTVLAILALLALADYAYQRYDYRKRLRMTKQEVKDERKQQDGDPEIKKRLHRIRVTRLRQIIMKAVPEADVVVTNPTHFAVALQYKAEHMVAPRVVAKGRDLVALKIREIAEAHDVPVVENPPLARALHDSAEVDQEIPVEHYKAVAEVIGYVMRLKGGLRSARPGA